MSAGEPLLALVQESLSRGHWRVACRRYLMLDARRIEMPRDVRIACERLLLRCSEREIRRMQVDAARWAGMCSPMRPNGIAWVRALCAPPTEAPSLPAAGIRTQWRPLPSTLPA
ncbi:hypothetical protein [Ramlibacter alkalitolerans]|uniref:Uncharacterized protein n=1 Tax=Ramlibacter alkalitolerans TaxID=2039631 RepID=A0ABS1JQ18_9BURK|nr:hypothetical protein [Ramlibacter alkalitolerans]MBL0426365.1 hypothetical protein [Ramlibacter alkalitolerans]